MDIQEANTTEDPPPTKTDIPIGTLKVNNAPFALRRFIENAQREIESLSDADEKAAAEQRLHAEMVRKFMPEAPKPTKARVRDVSVAECEAEQRTEDIEQIKEQAESDLLSKYDNPDDALEPEDWETDREPRTRMQKTNVAKASNAEISRLQLLDGDGKKIPAEIRSHVMQAAGLECAGNYSAPEDPIEAVDEGDYFEEQHAEFTPSRPYHDRVAGVMFRASQAWKKHSKLILYCQREGCENVFQDRKGTKFCSDECRKRHHEQMKAENTRR